eukprot:8857323-Karenia_brevis.AAC.1
MSKSTGGAARSAPTPRSRSPDGDLGLAADLFADRSGGGGAPGGAADIAHDKMITKDMHDNFIECFTVRKNGTSVQRAEELFKDGGEVPLDEWWCHMFSAKKINGWRQAVETIGGDKYPIETKEDTLK